MSDTALRSPRTEFDNGVEAWMERGEFDRHLGRAVVGSLKRYFWRQLLIDRTYENRRLVLNGGKLLTLAFSLALGWRGLPERRVGVILPPGAGGSASNLGLVLAGKIPVNLNFSAGRAAVESALRQSGIRHVISSPNLVERFPDLPWDRVEMIDLGQIIQGSSKGEMGRRWLSLALMPTGSIMGRLGLPETGGDAEVTLVFTSGSSAEPKGVILTHRNLLANAAQIDAVGILPAGKLPLANLPLFHSFGLTTMVWYPALYGVRVASLPSPLDLKRIAEVVREESVHVLVGTPTFLRRYLKSFDPEDLRSVEYVVAGAEKSPPELIARWEKRFNSRWLEGYGVTEASPVVGVNLPEPEGAREGSIGRMLPGMAARSVSLDTHEPLPLGQTGVIEVRGLNIFPGYLQPGSDTPRDVTREEGWYSTGDIGRVDGDGFIFIEGRLSRFSKIAGEMVPHGSVEQEVIEAFGWQDAEEPQAALASVSDPGKGEALVLLTVPEVTTEEIRRRLTERGLPNLWIPRYVVRVDAIPALSSGKLDLRAVRTQAEAALGREAEDDSGKG